MAKSRDAFRTISEVADVLDTPTHVLRFWESKFTQIKPVKRAGGRRYYRPEDIDLLAGIKTLLHDQGLTIKGAQKLIREQGVKHVIELGEVAEAAFDLNADNTLSTPEITPVPVAPKPAITDVMPTTEQASADVEAPKMPSIAAVAAPVTPASKMAERAKALAAIAEASHVFIHNNKIKITPLYARLQVLRDAMRAA